MQGLVAVVREQDEITKAAERELAQRFREDVAEVLFAGEPLDDLQLVPSRAFCGSVRGCGWAVCPGRVGEGIDVQELHVVVLAVDEDWADGWAAR